jgi:hypothetical protein
MEEKGSDHRKAFGQFSSNKTQRSITSEPVKLELNSVSFVHFDIDFNERDIVIKQRRIYLLIAVGGLDLTALAIMIFSLHI